MVTLRSLDAMFGTECVDIDLREPLDHSVVQRLRDDLDRRHLLVFRDQQLTGAQQHAFVSELGPVAGETAGWGYVSNVRPDGIVREGALLFHSDFAFTATPVLGISLHALEVPADGSPTLFADATGVVSRMPPALRQRLEPRRVRNVYDFAGDDATRMRVATASPGSPWYDHPVVTRNPRTGEAVMIANELHSDSIVGLPEAESEALLSELFSLLYAEDNLYEHRWTVGDLVIWDNVALQHGRRVIPLDEPRTLQRVTIAELTPSEMVPNLAALLAAR